MYVGTHHFQRQNRYFEDSVYFAVNQLWFAPYGLLGYELDTEALTNGTLALVHARGIFPDGLPFHMPEHDPLPPPRAIADLFPPTRDRLEVSLAIPAYRADGMNCLLPGALADGGARYVAEPAVLPDENTGRDAKPVDLARKSIRFLLETEPADGFISLPLARIRRDHSGKFVFDERRIPPCLRINASGRLMHMLSRMLDVLREKSRAVVKPRDLGNPSASGFSAEGIANAWFVHCISASIGPLAHLFEAKGAHPEELYRELARLAGALCTFSLDSQPGDLPLYDHDNPGETFEALDRHIRAHLDLVVPSNRVVLPLELIARFFYAGAIADERTLHRSRWIFGIHCQLGESELIESTPRLVKFCSREFIPKLVQRALPGLKLTHLPVPPPALSPKLHMQYFAIDKAGPCWEHMVKTREFGLYVPGELPDPELELSVILES
jgi:type VI secretion system protein ImpJ